jgi:hypothetical protein
LVASVKRIAEQYSLAARFARQRFSQSAFYNGWLKREGMSRYGEKAGVLKKAGERNGLAALRGSIELPRSAHMRRVASRFPARFARREPACPLLSLLKSSRDRLHPSGHFPSRPGDIDSTLPRSG